MPRRANIRMNKNSRNNKLIMDLIEASNEITKFRNDDQYLCVNNRIKYQYFICLTFS